MNQKKTFALLAALLALALGLVACGGGSSSSDTTAEGGGATTSEGAETGAEKEAEGGGNEAGGGEKEAEKVPVIEVKEGEPVGGIAKLEYDEGETIRFKVKGDEGEEIHVHGYDLMKDIPEGGGTVEFEFPAELEGIFEAELEGKGVQIIELRVNPS